MDTVLTRRWTLSGEGEGHNREQERDTVGEKERDAVRRKRGTQLRE